MLSLKRFNVDVTKHEPPPKPGGMRVLDSLLGIVEMGQDPQLVYQVAEDLVARAEVGRERYGTYLEAHNGRDATMDAYQEALDLLMYLEQIRIEAHGDPQIADYMSITLMVTLGLRARL